jgi:hypothetical protein
LDRSGRISLDGAEPSGAFFEVGQFQQDVRQRLKQRLILSTYGGAEGTPFQAHSN